MRIVKILALILIPGLLTGLEVQAQSRTFTSTDESQIVVTGTSTLHDWELRSGTLKSEVIFNTGTDEGIESLESVMFIVETSSLESDRSRLQNLAHEELDARNHPEITFRASGNGTVKSTGNEYRITTKGELTIAGVSRQVSIEATCIDRGSETLVCTGTEDLRMTDFDVDPPTLMLGTIRTDDEITVEFRIIYAE
jgi:hypothetical protein